MAKKYIIIKSIRNGVRGPRLRIHMFINGAPDWSIIFSPNETLGIYEMIDKNLALKDKHRIKKRVMCHVLKKRKDITQSNTKNTQSNTEKGEQWIMNKG